MKTHVIVIPSDGIISVDGEVLFLDGIKTETFHALQWHDGSGHVEPGHDLPNEDLTTGDYAGRVAPFVALWEEEKERLEAEAAAAEEAYNSLENVKARKLAAIEAGTQFTVPQYEVGSVALEVFLDGVACMIGEQYAEVGSKGQTSTKITWNIEVATDRDILVRCK